jgi:hypothetical protein
VPDRQNRAVLGDIHKVKYFSELNGRALLDLGKTWEILNATITVVRGTSAVKKKLKG